MKVHLIRHGETVTSGRTYAGRSDVPLNARGAAQARAISRALADVPIARIITSPLSRAIATATPLGQSRGFDLFIEPDLTEFDFGIYEGRTKQDLGLKLRKTHAYMSVPGGESLFDVWGRAGRVLAMLDSLDLRDDAAIVLVGHFWINRLLFGQAMGLDFQTACKSTAYRPIPGSAIVIERSASIAKDGPRQRSLHLI